MIREASGATFAATDTFEPQPYIRVPYVRRCALFRGARVTEAVLCNLSVMGVYVTFARPEALDMPQPGQVLRIAFLLPGDPLPLEAEVAVTWQNLDEPGGAENLPPGCGLRFVSLRPEDHHRIGALVHDYQHAATPRLSVPRPYSGFVRVPYVQSCALDGDARRWDGVLCNVSLVGAYVTLEPAPPVGTGLRLSFRVSGGRALDLGGEVAWVNAEQPDALDGLPPGCGIRFTDLSPEAHGHLETLIDGYERLPRPGFMRP